MIMAMDCSLLIQDFLILGKPAIDEGHYSIRYGEQIPVDSGTPKPIAGTLYPERRYVFVKIPLKNPFNQIDFSPY
jgi:hypothetical protein